MTKNLWLRMAILLGGIFPLIACSNWRKPGDAKYLLPVVDAQGNTSLQQIALPTLYSPTRVEGSVARIYESPQVVGGGHYSGSVAEPHLALSGDLYIPLDTDSGASLSMYAFFERIAAYESRVLVAQDVTFPREAAIFKMEAGLSAQQENNAFYMGAPFDEYALLPFGDSSRVDLAFNDGVLGHEHFHAHFDKLVVSQMPEIESASMMDVTAAYTCPQTDVQFEILIMRGWNEGLADFYGAMTSGNLDFMISSFSTQLARNVGGTPTRMQTRVDLRSGTETHVCVASDPYYNGLQIARALAVVAAQNDFPAIQETAQRKFDSYDRGARFVLNRLHDLKADLVQKNWSTMDPEYILSFLLKGVPLSQLSCNAIAQAVGGYITQGFPQCATQ